MNTTIINKNYKLYFILIILSLIFFGPFFAAKYVYENPQKWNLQTSNHGQLITPPLNINNLDLNSLTEKKNNHQWQIIYIINNICDEICKKDIFELRQVHIALGKHQRKINRAIVIDKNKISQIAELKQYSDITIFTYDPNRSELKPNITYISDPHGNIMLQYAANQNKMHVLLDLKKLLSI